MFHNSLTHLQHNSTQHTHVRRTFGASTTVFFCGHSRTQTGSTMRWRAGARNATRTRCVKENAKKWSLDCKHTRRRSARARSSCYERCARMPRDCETARHETTGDKSRRTCRRARARTHTHTDNNPIHSFRQSCMHQHRGTLSVMSISQKYCRGVCV